MSVGRKKSIQPKYINTTLSDSFTAFQTKVIQVALYSSKIQWVHLSMHNGVSLGGAGSHGVRFSARRSASHMAVAESQLGYSGIWHTLVGTQLSNNFWSTTGTSIQFRGAVINGSNIDLTFVNTTSGSVTLSAILHGWGMS